MRSERNVILSVFAVRENSSTGTTFLCEFLRGFFLKKRKKKLKNRKKKSLKVSFFFFVKSELKTHEASIISRYLARF